MKGWREKNGTDHRRMRNLNLMFIAGRFWSSDLWPPRSVPLTAPFPQAAVIVLHEKVWRCHLVICGRKPDLCIPWLYSSFYRWINWDKMSFSQPHRYDTHSSAPRFLKQGLRCHSESPLQCVIVSTHTLKPVFINWRVICQVIDTYLVWGL